MNSKISLKPEFKEERKAMRCIPKSHVHNVYLDKEQQEEYTAYYDEDNKIFVDASGCNLSGELNFILTCEKEPRLICDAILHHSYMANGKKVLASGGMLFENGKLIEITNNSGHFRPTDDEMLDAVKALYIASGGTLQTYTSFSSTNHSIYLVEALVMVNTINAVQPLTERDLLKKRNKVIIDGYDTSIDKKSGEPQDGTRYGKKLKREFSQRYSDLITTHSGLYASQPGNNDHNEAYQSNKI